MTVSPAYVVGYGMVDALGNSPNDCFLNMVNEYDPIQKVDFMGEKSSIQYAIPCLHDLSLPEELAPKKSSMMTKAQQMAHHAVKYALDMSCLPHSHNVAVILSSCSNDIEFLDGNFQKLKENKRVNPHQIVNRIPDMIVGQICTHYQFYGASVALQASCATGLYSIDYAMRILDEYDYVIVGGTDAAVNEMAMKYFSAIKALGNHNSPFDDDREGFVMGEGAGVLILQSLEKAQEYGSKRYAKLYPVGSATDGFNLTSPEPNGRGAKIALNKAMVNVGKKNINYVSAHATSTPVGDEIEYHIIAENIGHVPVYAPKSKIGHTLGAASVLECIYSIESMRRAILPGCFNLKNCSYDVNGMLVHTPRDIISDRMLQSGVLRTINHSFGFGGKCAAQIIEV